MRECFGERKRDSERKYERELGRNVKRERKERTWEREDEKVQTGEINHKG